MKKKSKPQKKPSKPTAKRVVKNMSKNAKNEGGIVPLHDRVVVRPLTEEDNKTASGIIIPETVSKEKSDQGIVVAVGTGRFEDGKYVPMSVEVGDKVMFSKYSTDEIKVDGKEYVIIKEEHILAILK